MNIIDWEYYNSHFPKLSEETFNKYVYSATMLVVKKLVAPYEELNEQLQINVKDCICNVINKFDDFNSNVTSVSNDGYSVSYASKTVEQQSQEIENVLSEWLGGLYARFVCF